MSLCTWTDEETDDNVLGSGAEMWDWYVTYIHWMDKANEYQVTMWDTEADEEGTPKVFTFTRDKVRETVAGMLDGFTFDVDDMDACDMDTVIQMLVYGEVVFG